MDQLGNQLGQISLQTKVTGLIYSEQTLLHADPKDQHPERPGRQSSIVKKIESYIQSQKQKESFEIVDKISPCSKESVELAHKTEYFDRIESLFEELDGQTSKRDVQWFGGDTYTNQHTANAARLAVQGTIVALDNVVTGKWSNAFAAVRPPGHHQGHVKVPNGFCIYNNVAIGLNHIRKTHKVQKVCIFDWDVHHGDGTEFLTYDDPNTLFISLHRYDQGKFYPGSGHPHRAGDKKAEGYNINVGWDVSSYLASNITAGAPEYLYAFHRLLEPIIQQFQPEVIIVSAGFDSAEGDPLGRCGMTPQGYAYITQRLLAIQSKMVVVLEGGYNLDAISEAAKSVFRVLSGERLPLEAGSHTADELIKKIRPNQIGVKAVEATLKVHRKFWPVLNSPELVAFENLYVGEESKFITGGHIDSFKIKGDKVYKKTKQNETQQLSSIYTRFYTTLNDQSSPHYEENQYLVRKALIPKFYGTEDSYIIMVQYNQYHKENLFHGMPNASIIDIKLGVKTYDPNGSPEKKSKELEKSVQTTNHQLGLRLAGFKYKNSLAEIVTDLHGVKAYSQINTEQQIKSCILKVLKSNEKVIQNEDALWYAIDYVKDLIDFIKTKSKRFFRSSSLLLAVDNIEDKFVVKWIDFNYVFPLTQDCEDPSAPYDRNILAGLDTVLRLLQELKGSQN